MMNFKRPIDDWMCLVRREFQQNHAGTTQLNFVKNSSLQHLNPFSIRPTTYPSIDPLVKAVEW
jgi:hypothetical protein